MEQKYINTIKEITRDRGYTYIKPLKHSLEKQNDNICIMLSNLTKPNTEQKNIDDTPLMEYMKLYYSNHTTQNKINILYSLLVDCRIYKYKRLLPNDTKTETKVMCVFTLPVETICVATLNEFMIVAAHLSVNHIYIIYKDRITPIARTLIKKCVDSEQLYIETICITNLAYNITKHRLVPKHTLVIEKTINNTTRKQLPKLSHTDPISRYYDFRPGDLIQVTRKSKFSQGKEVMYRLVE